MLSDKLMNVQNTMNMLEGEIKNFEGGKKSSGVIARKLILKSIALLKEIKVNSIDFQKQIPVKSRTKKQPVLNDDDNAEEQLEKLHDTLIQSMSKPDENILPKTLKTNKKKGRVKNVKLSE